MSNLLLLLVLVVEVALALMVKRIIRELQIGHEILELSEQLRKKTDELQAAINKQKE